MRGYTQLTQEERYQIYILKKAECDKTQIAKLLGHSKSTISPELRRNRVLRGYCPDQAHNLALMRRQDKIQPRLSEQIWQQAEALIREEWSPEQIVGRVAMEQGVSISHEWIYQYVYAVRLCRPALRRRLGDAGRTKIAVYGHPVYPSQND